MREGLGCQGRERGTGGAGGAGGRAGWGVGSSTTLTSSPFLSSDCHLETGSSSRRVSGVVFNAASVPRAVWAVLEAWRGRAGLREEVWRRGVIL